jgi:hypothetical protein
MLSILVTAYVALLPYKIALGNGVNVAPADFFIILILLLVPGQLRYRRSEWSLWHIAVASTFVVGSLVAALRFGTLDRYEFLNKDVGLLVPFLSYAAIVSLVGNTGDAAWNDVRRILRVFVVSAGLQNIISVGVFLLAYFFGLNNPFARYGGLRLSGMLLDPNAYGGFLVATFVTCEATCIGPEPLFKRPTLWVLRLTLAMGILFTFSRSAWIALGLSGMLFCILNPRAVIRLLPAAIVGPPFLLLLMGNRFVPVFEELASRPKQVQGRFDLINDALEAFTQHPFVGGGIGSFRHSEGEIAHNSAMWFLADFGIGGLIVLLGFIGWFFVKAWRCYRVAPPRYKPIALSLLLAHTAMFGLAMGIEAFYQRQWWVVLALIASTHRLIASALREQTALPPGPLIPPRPSSPPEPLPATLP